MRFKPAFVPSDAAIAVARFDDGATKGKFTRLPLISTIQKILKF